MLAQLRRVRKFYTAMVVSTFLVTPALGLWGAVFFGLISWSEIKSVLYAGYLPAFLFAMLAWVAVHFWNLLNPAFEFVLNNKNQQYSDKILHRCMVRFSRDYWLIFLFYAITAPVIYLLSIKNFHQIYSLELLGTFISLQLTISILAGFPAYLFSLDRLGSLVSIFGIKHVYNSVQFKIIVMGGLIPLLTYTLMLEYYWKNVGHLSAQTILVWVSLSIITITVTLLSVRSVKQSLKPVQQVLDRSGATSHKQLAQIKPQSTDEIGFLTQALGKVFQRLIDQESQMHAVVDNAAEAIIVTDDKGCIDTFNLAAENHFGYPPHEIRGKPISWLLPEIYANEDQPVLFNGIQKIEGVDRIGQRKLFSINVSEMRVRGNSMYTYLIDDITERSAAEEKQKKAETKYRDLVEAAHDLVWSMDTEGKWTYLNNACINIYGYKPQEMINRPFSDFQVPEYAEQEMAAFNKILSGDELNQFETIHLSRHGESIHLSFNARAKKDSEGNIIEITGTARDITKQKDVEKQLTYQAEHDALTGLYNRRYFQAELERVVARVTRNAATCAVLYVDLDQFKYINDTLGHAAGDRLLVEISKQLLEHKREGELLSRFGGDEFTLLLYNVDEENMLQAAENFRRTFEFFRFVESGQSYNVTCSIGAALIDHNISTADEALVHADIACNIAKSRGRNCVNVYDPGDHDIDGMAEDMGWAARVRDMLDNDRFLLVYQPIVSLKNNEIHSYEVLMRMPCDDGQLILPGGFMPAAERFGLIQNIDRWMVHKAILQLAELHEKGRDIPLSINLSGHAFEDTSLLPLIKDMITTTGLDPSYITFEITETATITRLSDAKRFISQLKELGCNFSLDDFGSGFCSFTYLKNLPVDTIKIDGSFIKNATSSTMDLEVIRSMCQIAHVLEMKTVAESVENVETFNLLKGIGIDFAQGHYLGSPLRDLASNDSLPSFDIQLNV